MKFSFHVLDFFHFILSFESMGGKNDFAFCNLRYYFLSHLMLKRQTDSLWVYVICLSGLGTFKAHRQAFVSHTTSFIYSDLPPYVFCRIALFSMPLLSQLDPYS